MPEFLRRLVKWFMHAGIAAALIACLPVLAPRAALRRRAITRGAPVRSLWAGTPIITLPVKARAERLLGVEADTLVYRCFILTDQFTYALDRWYARRWLRPGLYFAVYLWAVWKYDRLHHFCSAGLLPERRAWLFNPFELWFGRLLGKELFFWTYGADVRTRAATRALGEPNCCTRCPAPGKHCICDTDLGALNQRRLARSATSIMSMGDMIHYTPAARRDLFYWPLDLAAEGGSRYRPAPPATGPARPLRVVHAANHRFFKGTDDLIAAAESLRERGIAIELVLVEGMPNAQALEIYRSADVVFDQCLIGFHGYFAIEAMAMAKPVMCFIRDPGAYLLDPDSCPIVRTTKSRIADDLAALTSDRAKLREIGLRSRAYIEQHFTVAAFSERLHRAYLDLGALSSGTHR